MKRIFLAWLIIMSVSGCIPTIQIAAPSEPIEINLNIKIEHQIRIEVGKDLAELFEEESDIF
ncbi:MAG: YnbE family lipoprotein [Proteobacteria bacterium]|nr:YnbE family lipoprotein [Pseudomonadota bacterium]MCH8257464.1 YnbE family lipoprotein [Pseudomonadota bacterium]